MKPNMEERKMEKFVKLMNQYIADLAVLNVKFHNLHWNVVGERFVPVHVYLEEQYDDLFGKFDEVAERLKMMGKYPLASLKSYLDATEIKELENRDYQIPEVMTILKAEFTHLNKLATTIRKIADEMGDFTSVAMLEDHIAGYTKQLWFIESAMK